MKRFFILLLLLVVPFSLMAQEVKEHTVVGGETIQSIIAKYNITESDLRNANPGLDDYIFAGMTLKIPAANNSNELSIDDLKDVIYLKDGSELVAKILTIEQDAVKFEQYDTDEPFFLSKDKISSIAYENGETIDFKTPQIKTPNKKRRRR